MYAVLSLTKKAIRTRNKQKNRPRNRENKKYKKLTQKKNKMKTTLKKLKKNQKFYLQRKNICDTLVSAKRNLRLLRRFFLGLKGFIDMKKELPGVLSELSSFD